MEGGVVSTVIGVAIGIVFVFMLFSLFLSSALEAISAVLKLRGRALRVAIARLIADPRVPVRTGGFGFVDHAIARWMPPKAQPAAVLVADAVDPNAPERHEAVTETAAGDHRPLEPLTFAAVFCHPLIAGEKEGGKPSYVSDANFTSALLHALLGPQGELSAAALKARVALLPEGTVRTALESALLEAQGDWNKLRDGIDRWYAHAMDRLSGEYKRFSQFITFAIGLTLAAAFNIDSVALARQLYADPALREQLVSQATEYVAKQQEEQAVPPVAASGASAPETQLREAAQKLKAQRDILVATVPGASATPVPPKDGVKLGWLVTALAGMLGAPFWFDLLQKLTNLRGAGPKPQSAQSAETTR